MFVIILFFKDNSQHTLIVVKPPPSRVSLCVLFTLLTHWKKDCDPAPNPLFAYTHKASRTTGIHVVSCNSHVLQVTGQKQQQTLAIHTTRSPISPDLAICIGRCFTKKGIIDQGFIFFGTCIFENCSNGRSGFTLNFLP